MRVLPFLRPAALAVAAGTGVALAVLSAATGWSIASPGPLSGSRGDGSARGGVRTHAELESRCASCHPSPFGAETVAERCLDCHDEVGVQLARRAGLHGRLREARRCLECHTEHHGRRASLTRLDAARFPHEDTGWSLAAHRRTREDAPFRCADCHGTDLDHFHVERCLECHRGDAPDFAAAHLAAWGPACLACHDGRDRFGEDAFDHDATELPLTGAHRALACERCHEGARDARAFGRADPACASCHADDDAHRGRFGTDCGQCHDAAGWTPARFDHAVTGWPLDGAHVRVACAGCHAGARYAGTPRACRGCHTMPASHRGTWGDDCASCHSTATWADATFDHRFPLDHGGHGRVACATCHEGSYRTYSCYGCHEHSPARIAAEHAEEGIRDLRDCARCHPTGREEDEDDHGGDDHEGDD